MQRVSLELASTLACLDARCASMILSALQQSHGRPALPADDAATVVASRLDGVHNLAGLPPPAIATVLSARGAAVEMYYELLSKMLYGTLNAHVAEPTIVNSECSSCFQCLN